MEASGTPTAQPEPPPPLAEPSADEEQPGSAWRVLGIILALALAFAAAVMIIVMVDVGGTPHCDDPAAIEEERRETGDLVIECFEGSEGQKVASLALGWPSGVVAAIAALLALYFAVTGRRGQLLLRLTGLAVVLGVLSIVIGSI